MKNKQQAQRLLWEMFAREDDEERKESPAVSRSRLTVGLATGFTAEERESIRDCTICQKFIARRWQDSAPPQREVFAFLCGDETFDLALRLAALRDPFLHASLRSPLNRRAGQMVRAGRLAIERLGQLRTTAISAMQPLKLQPQQELTCAAGGEELLVATSDSSIDPELEFWAAPERIEARLITRHLDPGDGPVLAELLGDETTTPLRLLFEEFEEDDGEFWAAAQVNLPPERLRQFLDKQPGILVRQGHSISQILELLDE